MSLSSGRHVAGEGARIYLRLMMLKQASLMRVAAAVSSVLGARTPEEIKLQVLNVVELAWYNDGRLKPLATKRRYICAAKRLVERGSPGRTSTS